MDTTPETRIGHVTVSEGGADWGEVIAGKLQDIPKREVDRRRTNEPGECVDQMVYVRWVSCCHPEELESSWWEWEEPQLRYLVGFRGRGRYPASQGKSESGGPWDRRR